MFQVEVFGVHPADVDSMDLWNVGILPQHYAASQTRKPRLEFLLLSVSLQGYFKSE
jgi:hypothetical protein